MDTTSNELLNWLSNWFSEYCDDDWEHENQIKIQTVDNPGWEIIIDLTGTPLEGFSISEENNIGERDWYFYLIKDGRFKAAGDLMKLSFLLSVFRSIVQKATSSS